MRHHSIKAKKRKRQKRADRGQKMPRTKDEQREYAKWPRPRQ